MAARCASGWLDGLAVVGSLRSLEKFQSRMLKPSNHIILLLSHSQDETRGFGAVAGKDFAVKLA